MSVKMYKALSVLSLFVALTGCASTATVQNEPAHTTSVTTLAGPAVADSGKTLNRYTHLLIDPVAITSVADGRWEGVSEEQRQLAQTTLRNSFATSVGSAIPLTEVADEGVLRLQLTLEDVKLSHPVRASVAHILPIGLVVNLGKSAADATSPGSMGAVIVRGELRDARSNELLASFWTQQSPDPMNISAVVSQDTAITAAIERMAERFETYLSKAKKGEHVCQGNQNANHSCRIGSEPEQSPPSK